MSADICPICQKTNQCAISAGAAPSSCWCMQSEVSITTIIRQYLSVNPELTASLAAQQQCICASCLSHIQHTLPPE
ncbi:cysteine-rich CWC family protein [Shewanella gaetbuli]|uniref:Cysteine-rich CWC family protein n=1 Tax=Shewanella gaetbuli TaxID=220752 RepID=A0A9X1ZJT5_9GAMM|nr:cysteine-rich CWC family protein [Shewanella gaetbuli]MCL1142287.1 cysteine-rich CWC family protein [Shewanella gaetbuli]